MNTPRRRSGLPCFLLLATVLFGSAVNASPTGTTAPRPGGAVLEGATPRTVETTPTFSVYRVPSLLSPRANRDIEFLWSSTYSGSPFFRPLVPGTAPNDLDQLGINACETIDNPMGYPMTDVQLVHNFLCLPTSFRSRTYNPDPALGPGFRVNQSSYPDAQRTHVDAYIYTPRTSNNPNDPYYDPVFAPYGGDDPRNYGQWTSSFTSAVEDTSTDPSGTVWHANSLQIPGPAPGYVGATGAHAWGRSNGPADFAFCHEFQHDLNAYGGSDGEIFSSLAEALVGGSYGTPQYDVPFTWSLFSQNYQAWESWAPYLLYNFRGADTTSAHPEDDLVWRWAANSAGANFSTLAGRLSDAECLECQSKAYMAGLNQYQRLNAVYHNWRVANYIENGSLAEGQYGFGKYGFSPSATLGNWQDIDGIASDNAVAIPSEATVGNAQIRSDLVLSGTRTSPDGQSTAPMELQPYGAEYWVVRADNAMTQTGRDLVVRAAVDQTDLCFLVPGFPIITFHGQLMMTVVGYNQSQVNGVNEPLWKHPTWAQTVIGPVTVPVDSSLGAAELVVPNFGSTYKAALVVITLVDQYNNELDGATLPYRLNLGVRTAPYLAANPTPFVVSGAMVDDDPAWKPTGDEIAYQHFTMGTHDSRIYRKKLDGSSNVLLTSTSGGAQYDAAWSPRGDWVAFDEEDANTDPHVWLQNVDTGERRQLTSGTRYQVWPAFSPNGQQLAYSAYLGDANVTWQLHVVNLDGSGNQIIFTATGHALQYPHWTPAGDHIDFTEDNVLYTIPSTGGTPSQVSTGGMSVLNYDLPVGNGPLAIQTSFTPTNCGGTGGGLAETRVELCANNACLWRFGGGATPRVTNPGWSYDGVRLAMGMGPAGGADMDLWYGQASLDHAPAFTGSSAADVLIEPCVLFSRTLSATDPDGDAVTFQAVDLPPGATFNGTTFNWTPDQSQAVTTWYVVFRALDAYGGADNRVVRIDVDDACQFQCPPGHHCYPAGDPTAVVPAVFALGQSAPNPAIEEATIHFDLPKAQSVRLDIYDVQGRLVRRLSHDDYAAGRWFVRWDRRTESGMRAPMGTYFYRLVTPSFTAQKKMVLLP